MDRSNEVNIYATYRDFRTFKIIDAADIDLIENQDIIPNTSLETIVGYIVHQLLESGIEAQPRNDIPDGDPSTEADG